MSRIVQSSPVAPDSRHHRRAASEFARFVEKLHQQAVESREERWPLYMEAELGSCTRVLDVGCGPGGVTADVVEAAGGQVVALDAAAEMLHQARAYLASRDPVPEHRVPLVQGDGHRLPFPDGTFDAVVCNLYLMWARDPQAAVDEMARVVRPGGVVLASLEPDFGGKLHYPEDPEIDHVFQGAAILRRGGDPHIGRKLRALFVRAGLDTEVGLGNRRIWSAEEDRRSFDRAIDLYRSMLRANGIAEERIVSWEAQQRADFDAGVSFQFFPQFYARGHRAG